MALTKIINDQLKDLTLKNDKIAVDAAIEQTKIVGLVPSTTLADDLTAINAALASKLEKAGDTMTGPLVLHADPTDPLHSATKQYVDTRISRNGDVMLDFLTLNADPINPLHAVTKQYTDNNFLSLAGGVLSGSLTLNADPTLGLEAATKQYVDSQIASGTTPANYITGPAPEWNTADTVTIKAGSLYADDNNLSNIIFLIDTVIDINNTGAGGLMDTLVKTNDTWYYLWAIGDSTGTNPSTGIITDSTTDITNMPLGYDRKRLLPLALRVHSDGSFTRYKLYNWPFQPFQVYKDFEYQVKTPQQGGRYTVLFNGTSSTWTPISTSVIQSLVPPISNSISAQCCSDSGYGSGYIRPTGSSLTVGRVVYSAETGSHDNNTVYNIELGINQGLDYYVGAGAGNGFHMEIFGFYVDNLG